MNESTALTEARYLLWALNGRRATNEKYVLDTLAEIAEQEKLIAKLEQEEKKPWVLKNDVESILDRELPRQETVLTEHFDRLLAILERHFCFSNRNVEREIMDLRKAVLADREEAS
jgi:hypothetical protein